MTEEVGVPGSEVTVPVVGSIPEGGVKLSVYFTVVVNLKSSMNPLNPCSPALTGSLGCPILNWLSVAILLLYFSGLGILFLIKN